MADLSATPSHGFEQDFPPLAPVTRVFPRHYFLYASEGALRLAIGRNTWLLPPQRAALIAAGTQITVSSRARFTACSALFDPARHPAPGFDCRVFAVTPLVRELARLGTRWGARRDPDDAEANAAFLLLWQRCSELARTPDELWLPQPSSEALARAVAHVDARLDEPHTLEDLAKVAAASKRTLARRFPEELGLTWREYLLRSRMIRAMELLSDPRDKISAIALAVGFNGQAAFSTAFSRFSGETPSRYRERILRGS